MAANGKMDVCYSVQTAVNAKHKLLAEFEVTNAGTDHNQLTPVVERTKTALRTETLTVVADAGYDSVQDIAEEHGTGSHTSCSRNGF
jgi:transposase